MLIDQSKKSYFLNYSSLNKGSSGEKIEILIGARTVDTVDLRIQVQKRIKELNRLLKKIDKLEQEK